MAQRSDSKPIDMASLVEYRDGSIVSKQLIKKTAGNITLFAFDKGEGLSEHSAPFDALVYIMDGKAEITVGPDTYTAREGETLLLPAQIPHSLTATERFKMMLTMIKS